MSVTESSEVRITSIEFSGPLEDVGAAACKAMPPGRRYRYKRHVTYTLEDGRNVTSSVQGATKPRMQWEFDHRVECIQKHSLFAGFSNEGKFWGTSWKVGV